MTQYIYEAFFSPLGEFFFSSLERAFDYFARKKDVVRFARAPDFPMMPDKTWSVEKDRDLALSFLRRGNCVRFLAKNGDHRGFIFVHAINIDHAEITELEKKRAEEMKIRKGKKS